MFRGAGKFFMVRCPPTLAQHGRRRWRSQAAESDEAFTATLSNPSGGAVIAAATADGPIINDDIGSGTPHFSVINVPGANGTGASAINNVGKIAETYGAGAARHGFVLASGQFTTINCPDASTYTTAYGINDLGQIVGDPIHGGLGYSYSAGVFGTSNQ